MRKSPQSIRLDTTDMHVLDGAILQQPVLYDELSCTPACMGSYTTTHKCKHTDLCSTQKIPAPSASPVWSMSSGSTTVYEGPGCCVCGASMAGPVHGICCVCWASLMDTAQGLSSSGWSLGASMYSQVGGQMLCSCGIAPKKTHACVDAFLPHGGS